VHQHSCPRRAPPPAPQPSCLGGRTGRCPGAPHRSSPPAPAARRDATAQPRPGALPAAAPRQLAVSGASVLAPPLRGIAPFHYTEGKAFSGAFRRLDRYLAPDLQRCQGTAALQLELSRSLSVPTLGVFSSLTTSLQIHPDKPIQLFLYRQDLNLSI